MRDDAIICAGVVMTLLKARGPGLLVVGHTHSLGKSLLHQRSPELVLVLGPGVHQLTILSGEEVIHHHVHPLPKAPEVKVKYSSVTFWVGVVPILEGEEGGECGGGDMNVVLRVVCGVGCVVWVCGVYR